MSTTGTPLTFIGRVNSSTGYGLVYDSVQDLTWTQLGQFTTVPVTWGTAQYYVSLANTGTYYDVAGGWRLPVIAEMSALYRELPGATGLNKTGIQWFGSGPNDYFNVAHAWYWSNLEVGPGMSYAFNFASGSYEMTLHAFSLNTWAVHAGNLAPAAINEAPTAIPHGLMTINPVTRLFPGHVAGEWSNSSSFAALRADGSVMTWGGGFSSGSGGDSSSVAGALDGNIDVRQVFSTDAAFAALRADGSVVTWGDANSGGDSTAVTTSLDGAIDVTQVFSTQIAFAALRADGSVVTWGDANAGGNSSTVAVALTGAIDVTQVCSTWNAFAALRADGSVVAWGNAVEGG